MVKPRTGWGSVVPGTNGNIPGEQPDHDGDGIHDAEDPDHPSGLPEDGGAACKDVVTNVLQGETFTCTEAVSELSEMGGCEFDLSMWPGSTMPTGTLLTDSCPVTCGRCAEAVHPSLLSYITSGTCEATPGCAPISDQSSCVWVGTAVEDMVFNAGNGHMELGVSQQHSSAGGCVYNTGLERLKWNPNVDSSVSCSDQWGCFCAGTCAPVALESSSTPAQDPAPAPPTQPVHGPDKCSAVEAASYRIETHKLTETQGGEMRWELDSLAARTKSAAVALVSPVCATCADQWSPDPNCALYYATVDSGTALDERRSCVHNRLLWSQCVWSTSSTTARRPWPDDR
jgi:hypothetical protein